MHDKSSSLYVIMDRKPSWTDALLLSVMNGSGSAKNIFKTSAGTRSIQFWIVITKGLLSEVKINRNSPVYPLAESDSITDSGVLLTTFGYLLINLGIILVRRYLGQ